MERDVSAVSGIWSVVDFNSHAHVERDAPALLRYVHGGYFNSHAHVERDTLRRVLNENVLISTHTLTWSVTNRLNVELGCDFISTHTLTWSVTSNAKKYSPKTLFQLTRSRGA